MFLHPACCKVAETVSTCLQRDSYLNTYSPLRRNKYARRDHHKLYLLHAAHTITLTLCLTYHLSIPYHVPYLVYNLHYAVHISSFMSFYMNECLLISIIYLFHRVLDIFFFSFFFLHSSSLQFFYFLLILFCYFYFYAYFDYCCSCNSC